VSTVAEIELGKRGLPIVHEEYVCPRCDGRGGDPHVKPRQSCLICWGEGTVPAWKPAWSNQHELLVRELLLHHGTPVTKEADDD
jgi:DnaJ-class molecular chaperone